MSRFNRRIIVATRRLLVRRPWLYWCGVAVATVVVWSSWQTRLDDLAEERAVWGTTVAVLVAAEPIDVGTPIVGAVESASFPAKLVPPSAITHANGIARHPIAAGEIIVASDISITVGPLALVPDGWAAVAIVESPASDARVGERVQVVSEGVVIAAEALVVDAAAEVTIVAMPAEAAPAAAHASQTSRASLVRSPEPSG